MKSTRATVTGAPAFPCITGGVRSVEEAGRHWDITVEPAVKAGELKSVAVLKLPPSFARTVGRMNRTMMRLVFLSLLTAVAFLLEPIVSSEVASATIRPDVLLIPLVVAVVAWPGSVGCGLGRFYRTCLRLSDGAVPGTANGRLLARGGDCQPRCATAEVDGWNFPALIWLHGCRGDGFRRQFVSRSMAARLLPSRPQPRLPARL